MPKKRKSKLPQQLRQNAPNKTREVTSLLDEMKEGREYESIVNCQVPDLELAPEIKRSLDEISLIRERPVIAYVANVVNSEIRVPITITPTDDLPFSEMIDNIDASEKNIDIILVTPGGYAEQVARFVNKLRPRFDNVGFILPYMAMSAGTMFCLSGDELIMDSRAYIGPIDPQVPSKDGRFIPAQALIALINDIEHRGRKQLKQGQQPNWTDIQILNNLDGKEIGNAITASNFSTEMVANYLVNYKFKTWAKHSSSGEPVTPDEKRKRAKEIADQLCNHSLWKTHSRGISREMAHSMCRLKVTHPENTPNLLSSMRRFWALMYWTFERSSIYKVFISKEYSIFRFERSSQNTENKGVKK